MALVRVPSTSSAERAGARAVRRRRRYSLAEKQRLVAEATRPGASIAAVALRYGINANLLFNWRRQLRRGQMVARPGAAAVPASFVPVGVIGRPGPPIEIELPNGARLRVGSGVEATALCQVLRALKEAW